MSEFFDDLQENQNGFERTEPVANSNGVVDLEESDYEIEKNGYSKYTYKHIRTLRADGVATGNVIPALHYPLIKPDKKRMPFIVFGVISAVFMLIAAALAVYVLIKSVFPNIFGVIGDVSELSNGQLSMFTLGISSLFGAITSSFFWAILIGIMLLCVAIISYTAYYVFTFFNLSRCSVQEMAKGFEVRGLLGHVIFCGVLFGAVVGVIVYGLLSGGQADSTVYIIFGIFLALFLYFLAMIICILTLKKKALETFKSYPEEEQRDYIKHVNACDRVRRRFNRMDKYDDKIAKKTKSKLGLILMIGGHFATVRVIYNILKGDDYTSEFSTILGRKCRWHLFYFGLLVAFAVSLLGWFVSAVKTVKIFAMIISMALLISLLAPTAILFATSLNLVVKQMKLNRRVVSIVNLIVFIAIIVAAIVAIILIVL